MTENEKKLQSLFLFERIAEVLLHFWANRRIHVLSLVTVFSVRNFSYSFLKTDTEFSCLPF